MSDPIRTALESRLASMTPPIVTAWENVTYTPNLSTPYQRTALLSGTPENPAMGSAFYREIGVFQVTLSYPLGSGPAAADDRANLIRNWFPRGSSLTASGVTVTIKGTPAIAQGRSDGSFWCVPVSIPYYANVTQ